MPAIYETDWRIKVGPLKIGKVPGKVVTESYQSRSWTDLFGVPHGIDVTITDGEHIKGEKWSDDGLEVTSSSQEIYASGQQINRDPRIRGYFYYTDKPLKNR